jgi:uncharacterized protein
MRSMEQEREVLTWADFDTAVWELAERVVATDGVPDMNLSIARGGLLIGGALGHALGVQNTYTMNVEFYTGVDERLADPAARTGLHRPARRAGAGGRRRRRPGLTLRWVQEFCAGKVGTVRTATIYAKPGSVVRPDYVWRDTDRRITFPWSDRPPVTGAGAREPDRDRRPFFIHCLAVGQRLSTGCKCRPRLSVDILTITA